MSAVNRSELIAVLTELAQRHPQWRMGQLIANLAGWADQDVWDIEDDQLLTAAEAHLEQLASREEEARA